ncbi:MAG: DNA polymerase Y family protein, partial [Verrucomicrobiota bacterium]
MFAVIHLPHPHLQALLVNQPSYRNLPVVVLDDSEKSTTRKDGNKARVIEVSSEAAEFQIHRSMTAVQAQARCDMVQVLNRCLAAETALRQALLQCADQFTPDYENTALGLCTLDLTGIAEIEQEAAAVGQEIVTRLEALEYRAFVGIAEIPDLATLAARSAAFLEQSAVVYLQEQNRQAYLEFLPIELLEISPKPLDILHLWGVRTLGAFVQLGRAAVVERLGEELGVFWDLASGKSQRLLQLERPETEYKAATDLDHAIDSIEPAVFLMRRLLDEIVAQLQNDYLVAERLSLRFFLDDGRTYHRWFRIPEPTGDVTILVGLLQVHLDGFILQAPMVGIELRAIPSRPHRHQFDLFAAGVKDPNQLAETLARAEAILGSERVGVPQMKPSHRDDSFHMLPYHPTKEPPLLAADQHDLLEMDRRPIKRFR